MDLKKYPDDFPELELKIIKENGDSELKAIRRNCLECKNGSAEKVRLCPFIDCPLYPYRLGKSKTELQKILKAKLKNKNK